MPPKEDAEKSDIGAGCALTALGMVAGFAAIEGGIVLVAWSLHQILGGAPFLQRAMIGGVAGVLLLFAGPQFWFASSRFWPRVTVRQAIAAFPDLALAAWFVLGWAAPQVIGVKAAGMLVGVMVLEFIIIHASIALIAAPRVIAQKAPEGAWWRSERAVFGALVLMYSVAAGGISAAFKTAWLFLAFWLLIANKFIGDWLAPAGEAQQRLQRHGARWGLSAGLYLLLTAGSIFVPVPRLGAISGTDGEGLWEQHPEQAVMMGALYFALLGFCELYGGFNQVRAAAVTSSGTTGGAGGPSGNAG